METKQTAVDWLEELLHFECKYSLNNEVIINYDVLDNIIMKAKQMEKEQINKAWENGFMSTGEGWNGEIPPECHGQVLDNEEYYNKMFNLK